MLEVLVIDDPSGKLKHCVVKLRLFLKFTVFFFKFKTLQNKLAQKYTFLLTWLFFIQS